MIRVEAGRSQWPEPTIAEIKLAVAERFGLTVRDLESDRRARYVARPRQLAMFLARTMTHHSLPVIGRAFGGRDHTTVMHAIAVINKNVDMSMHLAPLLERIDAYRRRPCRVMWGAPGE